MKKLLSLLLALTLLLSLAGCGESIAPAQVPAQSTAAEAATVLSETAVPSLPLLTEPSETLPPQIDQTDPPETLPPQGDQTDPPETLPPQVDQTDPPEDTTQSQGLDKNGSYTTKEDVALYIHIYGCLPPNFMTKSVARTHGWKSGSLEKYAPGYCIGGDVFKNKEGLLPDAPGRVYRECDIDTLGSYSSRGSKRIVYSNDGLVYYTANHYESFTLLYGAP